jgi:hypothetical protein
VAFTWLGQQLECHPGVYLFFSLSREEDLCSSSSTELVGCRAPRAEARGACLEPRKLGSRVVVLSLS